MEINNSDFFLDGMPAVNTKLRNKNFEKYYDYKTENELMAVHRTKGAKMQVQSKQDLREEIKRQQAIIDQLLNTIVEQQKDVAFIKELITGLIEKNNEVNEIKDVRVSNTVNTMREKLKTGDFLPKSENKDEPIKAYIVDRDLQDHQEKKNLQDKIIKIHNLAFRISLIPELKSYPIISELILLASLND